MTTPTQRIIRMADLTPTAWKNGGGITREIAARRDAQGLLWRLSMADVAGDGAFSSFEGLTRVLTVTQGSGMILHGPEGPLRADFAAPVVFDGGAAIRAELTSGAVRDFNLMFDTARVEGVATCIGAGDTGAQGGAGETAVLHVITGAARLGADRLGPGDTALAEGMALHGDLPEGACALMIRLRPRLS